MTHAVPGIPAIVNAMTVDVEDYFQVAAFEKCIRRVDWPHWPVRVDANTRRILDLFAQHEVHATFFILGWVAERFPQLVRDIAAAGHEIASHGYGHERLVNMERAEFRADITRTRHILEDLAGSPVLGYRAPSYSIGPGTLWAYDELRAAGYRYSSSVVPIHHDLYGMPQAPRFPFWPDGDGLLEIPVTTVRLLGRNWACGGGGYFRLLPFAAFRAGFQRVNQHDRKPGVFYFHPWEIDPGQPRVSAAPLKSRFRHYINLERTAGRIDCLLHSFAFDRMDRVFLQASGAQYPRVSLQPDGSVQHRENASCPTV